MQQQVLTRASHHSGVAAITASFGLLMALVSLTMLPPIGVELIYHDGAIKPFVHSFWIMLLLGFTCWFAFRNHRVELRNWQGFFVVVAVWLAVPLLSALPFALMTAPHMSFIDAIFESTSGLTTTGATVLDRVDGLPHSILYYRAQLNFIGGIGIVVLAVAVLPMFGIGGMQLYKAETPGPFKDEKLTPRITETAKRLSIVYLLLVASCAFAYWSAGMGRFDALCHAFATLALGGFSTHTESLGYFHSPAIEVVGGVFSLVAGINFALLFLCWTELSWKPVLRDPEFRFYMGVMGALVVVVCLWLYLSGTFGPAEAAYHGFFETISIATDNGLVAGHFPSWPAPIALLLIMASFFGGCVGSTCGGIKAMRYMLLAKQSARELQLLVHPHAVINVKIRRRAVPERAIEAIWAFYFFYVFAYTLISFGVTATGIDIVSAFGSTAACLNNMGVGYGVTASSFESLNDTAKSLLVFAMLLGRLELFPILLLFTPTFWKN